MKNIWFLKLYLLRAHKEIKLRPVFNYFVLTKNSSFFGGDEINGSHGIGPTWDCNLGIAPNGIAPKQDCTQTGLHPNRIAPNGIAPNGIAIAKVIILNFFALFLYLYVYLSINHNNLIKII